MFTAERPSTRTVRTNMGLEAIRIMRRLVGLQIVGTSER